MMLRKVEDADLEIFYAHQRDPQAASMAVFSPREWDAFVLHWRHNVLGIPANDVRTILVGDEVAGYVCSWEQDGKRLVAYWIGRNYWGQGVASAALGEFLKAHEHHRPIHAEVAVSNRGSIRVLEKCGFHRIVDPDAGPDGVSEWLFKLDGGS